MARTVFRTAVYMRSTYGRTRSRIEYACNQLVTTAGDYKGPHPRKLLVVAVSLPASRARDPVLGKALTLTGEMEGLVTMSASDVVLVGVRLSWSLMTKRRLIGP